MKNIAGLPMLSAGNFASGYLSADQFSIGIFSIGIFSFGIYAVLYAAMVSIVYLVVIIYVTPKLLAGQADEVAPFRFLTAGSFMQVLDGAGYFFMGLATLFAAPVFSGTRLENLTRWAFIANGVLSVPILLSYAPLVIPASIYPVFLGLGALWIFTTPISAFLAALCFRRSN